VEPGRFPQHAGQVAGQDRPSVTGAMIQLKKPPISQYVSQDQRFTPR
jgi:hypothetical protein